MNTPQKKRPLHNALTAVVAGVVLMVAVLPLAAHADQDEFDRGQLVRLLAERYGESSVSAGIANNGGVVELLTSADGATWTLVMTLPNGSSEVIAAGVSWVSVATLPGEPI